MMTGMMGLTGPLAVGRVTGFGETGQVEAPPPQGPRAHSIHDVIFQMGEASDGSALVSAVSSEVTFRKVVYQDGRIEAAFERGRDRVSVVTTPAGVTISRGATNITLGQAAVTEDALGRVRTTWASSPALRAFRAMASAVESEDDATTPERLAVWLTGALVAQIDGDDFAVTRLARRLHRSLTGAERRASLAPTDCRSIYAKAVLRAIAQLEQGHASFSIWDPRRHGCGFTWTLQVEVAWLDLLACCSFSFRK